jgi:pimeloyl-ACP methyl ester carboxylesterase
MAMNQPTGYRSFHDDTNMNYQLNRFLGPEPAPEVTAIARRIHDYASWASELTAAADRFEALGEHRRAARYVRAAEFFDTPGDPAKKLAYERYVELFWRGREGWTRTEVPYPQGTLSVLRHQGTLGVPAPPFVICGGYDSFAEELVELSEPLCDAGFEVVAFDGPGQGEALYRHGISMVPEWEKPVAAVLDALGLDDVTFVGVSLGGYLAVRAAAYEPRIRRVVAFDVMYDFLATVLSHAGPLSHGAGLVGNAPGRAVVDAVLSQKMKHDPLVEWGISQAMFVTGTTTAGRALEHLAAFTTRDCSAHVQQDVLLLAGQEDHHVPLHQLSLQLEALVAARSVTARLFTAKEQASSHCQIGNTGLAMSTILAWTRERLAATPALSAADASPRERA